MSSAPVRVGFPDHVVRADSAAGTCICPTKWSGSLAVSANVLLSSRARSATELNTLRSDIAVDLGETNLLGSATLNIRRCENAAAVWIGLQELLRGSGFVGRQNIKAGNELRSVRILTCVTGGIASSPRPPTRRAALPQSGVHLHPRQPDRRGIRQTSLLGCLETRMDGRATRS